MMFFASLVDQHIVASTHVYQVPGGPKVWVESISHVSEDSIETWRSDGRVDNVEAGRVWYELRKQPQAITLRAGRRNLLVRLGTDYGASFQKSGSTLSVASHVLPEQRDFAVSTRVAWRVPLAPFQLQLKRKIPWNGGSICYMGWKFETGNAWRTAAGPSFATRWRLAFRASGLSWIDRDYVVSFLDNQGKVLMQTYEDVPLFAAYFGFSLLPAGQSRAFPANGSVDPVSLPRSSDFFIDCPVDPANITEVIVSRVHSANVTFSHVPAYPADK